MKNQLIKYLFSIIFCCISVVNFALADTATTSFHKIVFFGDSLSDNGNLFYYTIHNIPKTPPYYKGRFSNGPVWSEQTGKYFSDTKKMSYSDYAFGGETALFHSPIKGYFPYSLYLSVDSYLLHTIFQDRNKTLFVIWIGANDYLQDVTNVDSATNEVVSNIKDAINKLIDHGGVNFLIVNLPDLGRTPYGRTSGTAELLSDISNAHNQKLLSMVAAIQAKHATANIHIFDVNKAFNDFMDNTSTFDQQNNLHVTDTYNACWQGSYMLRAAQPQEIAAKMQEHMAANPEAMAATDTDTQQNFNLNGLANYVAHNPGLMEAYNTANGAENNTLVPCSNPDDYMFWDHLHPTHVIHTAIANLAIKFISENYNPI